MIRQLLGLRGRDEDATDRAVVTVLGLAVQPLVAVHVTDLAAAGQWAAAVAIAAADLALVWPGRDAWRR
jgi:hypothetical protein